MGGALANLLSTGENTLVALGTMAVAGLGAWGVQVYLRSRPTPAELERRRRAALHSRGKMGDATLLEYRENVVFYSYAVRGVEYTASQDLSDLKPLLPADLWSAIGPASVKYDPRNPANSMVLCERWSGLRAASRQT